MMLLLDGVLAASGFALGLRGRGGVAARLVGLYLLYACVPIVTAYAVAYVAPKPEGSRILVATWLVDAALVAAGLALARLCRSCGVGERGAVALSVALLNGGFLPIPLSLAFYGDVKPVLAYVTAYNVALPVIVPLIGVLAGGKRGGVREAARLFAGFPPLWGAAAGLLLLTASPSSPPPPIAAWYWVAIQSYNLSFYLVGQRAGEALVRFGLGSAREALVLVGIGRLVVSPAIHAVVAWATGLSGVALLEFMLESYMPPATMNLVYALYLGFDERLVAAAIAVYTPLSLVVAAFQGAVT